MDQIEQVRKFLLQNKKPSYQTTDKKEVRVRCPYCGDSKKDRNHAHMYIEMTPPFMFYCQRCDTSGVLNSQTLRDLGLYSNDLSVSVIEANKTVKRNQGVEKLNAVKFDTKLNNVENEFTEKAVDYVSKRMGIQLTNEELVTRYKAVTNAAQFFEDNRMKPPVGWNNQVMYDFYNSIGFLSSDGSHVIFRDMTGLQKKKYFNLNLQPHNFSISSKIYNISSSVNMMAPSVNLIITEGIFDIMGVYEHFYKDTVKDRDDYIFAASCGKGFLAVISHYVQMGFLDLNITIYSDSDVNIFFYKDLKETSPYLKNVSITVYYNTLEKDFGIPKDRIKLKKVII